MKNASGLSEVRGARDAIDAYKNITDAIKAAEAAANEAAAAAGNALNVSQRFADWYYICLTGYVCMFILTR